MRKRSAKQGVLSAIFLFILLAGVLWMIAKLRNPDSGFQKAANSLMGVGEASTARTGGTAESSKEGLPAPANSQDPSLPNNAEAAHPKGSKDRP